MKRTVILAELCAVPLAVAPTTAAADRPPGQLGYGGGAADLRH
jgi:hypothetical protein